uniref:Starch synthase, chloroplastic/amyloplastic n=1 Tax=Oryza meridionalis TaxID=40149 RepID=A0A0E0DW79_9ORYZ
MSALTTSQLATSATGFGIADRSAPSSLLRHGFQGLKPRSPAGGDATSLSVTTSARATPKQQRSVQRGSRRFPSVVVYATGAGMNVVFVGAEMAPWSKTGGLGDVLGGLPPAMAIKVADRYERVRFFHCYKRGVDRVFIDHPSFLEKVWGKTGEKIYGPDTGVDYKDNQMRFSLLCQAALEAPRILNLNNNPYFKGTYGEDVVFVCNDWHTGPLASYLKNNYQPNGIYRNAKVAFCIHNISYQGRFAFEDYPELNLSERFRSSFDFIDGYDTPVEGRKINWMKAGILEADRVLTVSPYYAEELISGIARGCELDNIMRLTGITGIVNGMDVSEWDPSKDKYITAKYDATTAIEAKALNKEALQAEAGLPVDRKIPLIAFIGRLEEQKGPDVMAAAIPELMQEDVQIVLLGTGKKKFEKLLKSMEEKYPGKVRAVVKFNAPLAHLIMAGADVLAVPSRFEPCGLIQLQGMRYGTPCACASTGGLVDTVIEGKTGFHMGRLSVDCKVVEPSDVKKVAATLKRAIKVVGTPAYEEMGPAKNWENVLLGLGVAGSAPGIEGDEIAPLAKENVAAP